MICTRPEKSGVYIQSVPESRVVLEIMRERLVVHSEFRLLQQIRLRRIPL